MMKFYSGSAWNIDPQNSAWPGKKEEEEVICPLKSCTSGAFVHIRTHLFNLLLLQYSKQLRNSRKRDFDIQ